MFWRREFGDFEGGHRGRQGIWIGILAGWDICDVGEGILDCMIDLFRAGKSEVFLI